MAASLKLCFRGNQVLDVTRLQLLAELRRYGTMGAVALAMNYSTSAVSQQLSKLETEAGVTLFERAGRGLRLTPAGERLADEADAVLEALERAESVLAVTPEDAGEVRLGVVPTLMWTAVPQLRTLLAAEHPSIRLSVSTFEPEEGVSRLLARRLDIMVTDEYRGMPRKRQSGLVREPLIRDAVTATLPRGVPADVDPRELDWVFEAQGSEAERWALSICREHGVEPNVRFYTPDLALQRHLVLSGLAAAFLPSVMRSDGDEYLPVPGFPDDLERQLYAAVRPGSGERAAVRATVSALRSTLNRLFA